MPQSCSICKHYSGMTCVNNANIQEVYGVGADGTDTVTTQPLVPPGPDWYCALFEAKPTAAVDQLITIMGLTVTTDELGREMVAFPWGPVERGSFKPESNPQNTMELLSYFTAITGRPLAPIPQNTMGLWKIKDERTGMEVRDVLGQNLTKRVTEVVLTELKAYKGVA